MAGNVSTGFAEDKGLPYGLDFRIAMEAILLLFVLVAGCGETDDCIQHVNMDTNGNVYYTFEGEFSVPLPFVSWRGRFGRGWLCP